VQEAGFRSVRRHDALVRLVGEIDGFCDDPIESGTFEALEPAERTQTMREFLPQVF
jgi:hypothetical protein